MKEKLSAISLYSIGILSALILILLGIKYVIPVLSPFLIAWLIVSITRSPAEKLSARIKVPARILRLLMSLLLTVISVSAVVILIWQASSFAWHFLTNFEQSNRLYGLLSSIFSPSLPFFGEMFPDELAVKISEMIGAMMSSALSALAEGITALATALPKVFLFLLVTIISLVYFSLDFDRISSFAISILPKKIANTISDIREGAIKTLGKYLRSYSLLIMITYLILLVGFMLLKIKNAAFIALLVSILDILPIIGVGTVLIPWSVFEIAMGNSFLGIGLIVLFVLNAVIRQFTEPKIVGKSLNIHPVVSLILIYVGYSLFGIMGLIILPAVAIALSLALKRNKTSEVG